MSIKYASIVCDSDGLELDYTLTNKRQWLESTTNLLSSEKIRIEDCLELKEAKDLESVLSSMRKRGNKSHILDYKNAILSPEFYNACMSVSLYAMKQRKTHARGKDIKEQDLEDYANSVYVASVGMFLNEQVTELEDLIYFTSINAYLIYDIYSYANFRKNAHIDEQGNIIESFKNEFDVVITRTVTVDTLEQDLEMYRRKEQEKSDKSLERLQGFTLESVERVRSLLGDKDSDALLDLLSLKASETVLSSHQRMTLSRLKTKLERATIQRNKIERLNSKQVKQELSLLKQAKREQAKRDRQSIKDAKPLKRLEREKLARERLEIAKLKVMNRLDKLEKRQDAQNVNVNVLRYELSMIHNQKDLQAFRERITREYMGQVNERKRERLEMAKAYKKRAKGFIQGLDF